MSVLNNIEVGLLFGKKSGFSQVFLYNNSTKPIQPTSYANHHIC
jgi:hypothetical protein